MFAALLKDLRERVGLTQYRLAELLGVPPRTYGSWERDERQPDFQTLVKIADYFDVTTDYLLGRTPMPIIVTEGNPPPLEGDQMEMTFTMDDPPAAPDELEQRMRDIIEEEFKKRGL